MSKTFEKLLIAKQILSKEKIEYYRCLQAQEENKRHLGEILFFEGILKKEQLDELLKVEFEQETQRKQKQKKKKDKLLLLKIKELGLVAKSDLKINKSQKENFCELFVKKGFLTPYMVRKLLRRKLSKYDCPEDLVVDITQYQKDRFLKQIVIKNEFVSEEQLAKCWDELKQGWPNKKLIEIFLEKEILNEKNAQKMLKVLERNISSRYPFYKYQRKDVALGRKIAKRKFLSPWRINKCLLKQVNIIRKQKKYVSLEEITIDDGYLTEYFFRKIIYSDTEMIEETEGIKAINKDDIVDIIRNAISDVHLVVDDGELEHLHLPSAILDIEDKEIEEIEEIDEEGLESIANFTRDHLGITASQTIHINEEDLRVFDDEESQHVNITLVSNSDDDDEYDVVIEEEDIGEED